jgi:hypothetical protein
MQLAKLSASRVLRVTAEVLADVTNAKEKHWPEPQMCLWSLCLRDV